MDAAVAVWHDVYKCEREARLLGGHSLPVSQTVQRTQERHPGEISETLLALPENLDKSPQLSYQL